MNVNSLYGSIGTQGTTGTDAIQPTTSNGSVDGSATSIGPAASATISTPGQFFSQLQQLAQTDPTQFKQVAAQLATNFQNAAGQATGPQAKFLSNLADQFNQAAQTGTMPAPQAPQGAQGAGGAGGGGGAHHHHHHGGGGGFGGQGSASNEVQQALESAMTILQQAMQTGASTSAATPSSSSGSSG